MITIRSGMQFQNDSPIEKALGKCLDLCGLNLLWLLCCVPVVTAGAATCALHFALGKREEGEGVFRSFFRGFRRNFRQATILWLMLLILGAFLFLSFRIAPALGGSVSTVLTVVLFIPALLLAVIAAYGFPLLARFEIASVGVLVIDAVMLGIAYFPKTLSILALNLLPVLLLRFLPSVLVCVLFVWVPVGFSLTALLIQRCLESVFFGLEDKTV